MTERSALRGQDAAARSGFRPDIQGLRAIAVLLVVLYHAGLPVSGGYIGVDVFFVISGFLITTHLLAEIRSTGRLKLGLFYARRARRILPASFVVLLATLIASIVVLPPAFLSSVAKDAIATALYVPNLLFAWRGTDYLAETAASPYQHYWSLGVEEQFYLLWPLLLLALFLAVRRSQAALLVCVGLVVVASFLVSFFLTTASQPWAFFSLPARAWELGVGAIIAVAGPAPIRRLSPRWSAIGGWGGIVTILAGAFLFGEQTAFPGVAALVPVLGVAAVVFLGQNAPRFGPSLILARRPLQFVGAISYSLYLVHWPLMVLPSYTRGRMQELAMWQTSLLVLVAVALAWLLNRFVENPMRTWKSLGLRRARVTLVAAALASVLVVTASLAVVATADRQPSSLDREAAPTVVSGSVPNFTTFVPSNLVPSLAGAASDVPVLYSDGCHLSVEGDVPQDCVFGDVSAPVDVVLFGDSHAAQWFPALEPLAQEHGFRLTVFTKSSCPSVDIGIVVNDIAYDACRTWRERVIDRIAEIRPAVVVLSNLADYGEQAPTATDASWAAGLSQVIKALPPTSRVLVLADTPSFGQTPSICLSANVADALFCARPRVEVEHASRIAAEKEVVNRDGGTYLDLNDRLCDATTCGVIIGSTLVYRDGNHMTSTFAAQLALPLWVVLRELI